MNTTPLTRDRIEHVYFGRPGCCCGCRGQHVYRTVTQQIGGKVRGYAVTGREVDNQTCEHVLRIINVAIEAGLTEFDSRDDPDTPFVSAQHGGRVFIVYLLPNGAAIPDGCPAFSIGDRVRVRGEINRRGRVVGIQTNQLGTTLYRITDGGLFSAGELSPDRLQPSHLSRFPGPNESRDRFNKPETTPLT